MAQYPIAPKTQAAGVSAAVSGAVLYVLQAYAFRGAVPAGIESLIYAAMPGVVAFAAAWLAPHQDRAGMTLSSAVPQTFTGSSGTVRVIPPEERLVIPGDPEPPPGM